MRSFERDLNSQSYSTRAVVLTESMLMHTRLPLLGVKVSASISSRNEPFALFNSVFRDFNCELASAVPADTGGVD